MLTQIFNSVIIAILCHTWIKLLNEPSFLSPLHTWIVSNVKNSTLLTWAGLGCEYCFTLFWGIIISILYVAAYKLPITYAIPMALLSAFFSYPITYIKNNI